MSDSSLNRIRNGDFSQGRDAPRAWRWNAEAGRARWRFAEGLTEGAVRSVRIETDSRGAVAGFAQRIRCRSRQTYRFEALVHAPGGDAVPDGRFELRIEQRELRGKTIGQLRRVGPGRCPTPVVWREYWRCEEGTRSAEVGVYWAGGPAAACVGLARCVPVEESEAAGHPLAIPPPPIAYPPPCVAGSVDVVGDGVPVMLLEALRACFGKSAVRCVAANAFDPSKVSADAVVILQGSLAKAIPSWNALLRLAASKLVVVGPELFARLAARAAGAPISVRTLRQFDDPLFVKVRDANFVTRGFALLDVFPCARFDAGTGAFELRCLRRTKTLATFLRKQGILTALVSEATTDATTDLPVCLVRPTDGGAVVVLDLSPFTSSPCTEEVLNLASFILLNALGRWQASVGQFVWPPPGPRSLSRELRDLVERFPPLRFEGRPPTSSSAEFPLVVLEAPALGDGHSLSRKATVLIRTRLDGDDWAGCYATLLWLKQLLRPVPWASPHVTAWLSEYRVVWSIVGAGAHVPGATDAALTIDLSTGPEHRCRVVVPEEPRAYYDRLAWWLPALERQLCRDGPTLFRPADGTHPADRAGYRWTRGLPGVEVVAGTAGPVAASSGECVRLELPRYLDNSGANSIWQTERAILLLEWLIGLHHGLLAVNRGPGVRTLAFPELGTPGRHVVLTADGARRFPAAPADGNGRLGAIRLEPGECLFVRSPEAPAGMQAQIGRRPLRPAAGRHRVRDS